MRAKAAAMIPDLIATFPAKLAEYQKAHDADVAKYSFDCRRHGDFLSVFLERGTKVSTHERFRAVGKVSHAINIGRVSTIQHAEGNIPDCRGSVSFTVTRDSLLSLGDPFPVWPQVWSRSETIFIASPDGKSNMGVMGAASLGDMSYQIFNGMHLADAPRPANDDRIEFNGTGVTLFMPAGMGRPVYDAIMREIGAGFSGERP